MAEKSTGRELGSRIDNMFKSIKDECGKRNITYRDELLKALKDECHKTGTPYMFVAVTGTDGKKASYYSDGITPGSMGMELDDDRIKKALNVLSGMDGLVRVTADEIGAEFDAMYDNVKVSSQDEWDETAAAAAENEGKDRYDY